jgi:hypothetical protein
VGGCPYPCLEHAPGVRRGGRGHVYIKAGTHANLVLSEGGGVGSILTGRQVGRSRRRSTAKAASDTRNCRSSAVRRAPRPTDATCASCDSACDAPVLAAYTVAIRRSSDSRTGSASVDHLAICPVNTWETVNSSETYDGVCGAAGLDRTVGREGGRACRSARLAEHTAGLACCRSLTVSVRAEEGNSPPFVQRRRAVARPTERRRRLIGQLRFLPASPRRTIRRTPCPGHVWNGRVIGAFR